MKTLIRFAAAGVLLAPMAWGAVSPQEAAHLGDDLTPLGGEKAANADGSIPAWTGGIKSAADAGFPNYKSGDHHPDPYASDKPLFTITTANLAQYAAKLTEGHKALLRPPRPQDGLHPTHRSASLRAHLRTTKRIATTATPCPTAGAGLSGTPFPPEVRTRGLWITRCATAHRRHRVGQVPMIAGGATRW
jgi:hypothetical protein